MAIPYYFEVLNRTSDNQEMMIEHLADGLRALDQIADMAHADCVKTQKGGVDKTYQVVIGVTKTRNAIWHTT